MKAMLTDRPPPALPWSCELYPMFTERVLGYSTTSTNSVLGGRRCGQRGWIVRHRYITVIVSERGTQLPAAAAAPAAFATTASIEILSIAVLHCTFNTCSCPLPARPQTRQ